MCEIPFSNTSEGIGLTCWAFLNAAKSVRGGNSIRTNRFFRYRLYAQSFTLVAMVGGSIYYKSDRMKRTEYLKLKDEQRAQEKREKWIKELEVRDAEDREWRTKLGKVQDLQREEEERLLVEQARTQRENASEDGKQVIDGIKKEINKTKRVKESLKKKRPGEPVLIADPTDAPSPDTRSSNKPKYDSILGEREEGGLLGYKYISGFYEHRLKPMWNDIFSGGGKEGKESKDNK